MSGSAKPAPGFLADPGDLNSDAMTFGPAAGVLASTAGAAANAISA
jgi:hypothetical protein